MNKCGSYNRNLLAGQVARRFFLAESRVVNTKSAPLISVWNIPRFWGMIPTQKDRNEINIVGREIVWERNV
jgi:hypothetical protein